MFLVAGSAIYGPALCGLERHFSFSAAVRTCNFVHSSAAISFLTHDLLTPLYRLVTLKIILKSRIHSVPNFRKHRSVIKPIPQVLAKIRLVSPGFLRLVNCKRGNFLSETEKVTCAPIVYSADSWIRAQFGEHFKESLATRNRSD